MTYFEWLMDQVEYFDEIKHPNLLSKLHSIEYVPVIERDKNRADDGISLRNDFCGEVGDNPYIYDTSCSFLEFLVALARRMNYIYARVDEDRTQDCFWTMIENMGLPFDLDTSDDSIINEAVSRIMNRTYDKDGNGNLFPLENPRTNQRNVEVWYQMNQYILETMRNEGRL